MAADVLGPGYDAQIIPLGNDGHGEITATLVSHRAPSPTGRAVLAVHGFCDYFFSTHVAERFAAAGFDFHALDLRAYGRSLRDGEPANYIDHLSDYDAELDAAVDLIGAEKLVVLGHSTGGLITALWVDRRPGLTEHLILNSPWFDLQFPWPVRMIASGVLPLLARVAPQFPVNRRMETVYGRALSAEHDGEWTYDLRWKPLDGFPARAGWLAAVRRGQLALHRGLHIDAPVLVLRSDRSTLRQPWGEMSVCSDTVLDTEQIAKWAPKLGPDVTVHRCDGALHDVFLSAEPVRTAALDTTLAWLDHP